MIAMFRCFVVQYVRSFDLSCVSTQVGVPWSHFCCELPSEELMRWQWVGRLKCIKFFLAYLDVGGLHINCLTSNWTSITCGTCTHDSCSISQIVTSWTLALIGTQRAWSTKWFVDGPVPLYKCRLWNRLPWVQCLEGELACHFLAYCSNREKFPFYIISVTPCISKPGLFDMKSAGLESKVCHLSFFDLCILEVSIPLKPTCINAADSTALAEVPQCLSPFNKTILPVGACIFKLALKWNVHTNPFAEQPWLSSCIFVSTSHI